jgi:hypothetical protein
MVEMVVVVLMEIMKVNGEGGAGDDRVGDDGVVMVEMLKVDVVMVIMEIVGVVL